MDLAILGLFGAAVTVVLIVVLDSFFLHVGAKLAGVRKATFGRAVLASIACAMSTLLLALLFSWIPVSGPGLGFLIGLVLTVVVLQAVYSTTFGKAFLLWLFNVAAQAAAVIIGMFLIPAVLTVLG